MSHFGVACGHFQFSATAQGADSVLAGNGPSQRRGRPGIPTVNRTLRTDSPRLCTSHPQVCAQASPSLPRRQPRDCRRRCRAAQPRDARFMPTMGPLLPPQGATGQGGARTGPPDSLRPPMIRPRPTSPSPTTGKDPAPHSFWGDGGRPAVTRLRTAADAGKPRITGAARRDRAHGLPERGVRRPGLPVRLPVAPPRR
jgi:hypothetical protein